MADKKNDNKKGILNEFKEFISKGNVVDMAVGVIVGSAFTAIVNSLVNDIFTPFLGMILAGVNFDSLGVTIPWGNEPYINFGSFIQSIISFLLTAICVFVIVKAINAARNGSTSIFKKKDANKEETPAPAPEPPKPTTEDLLAEIRDLLKEQNKE